MTNLHSRQSCGINYTESVGPGRFLETPLHSQRKGLLAAFFYVLRQRKKVMRSILYVIAVICIIGWLLGMFVWSATGLIHVLLVIAVISLLLGLIRRA